MTLCILGFFWLMHIYLVDRQMRFHGPLAVGNIVDQFFRNGQSELKVFQRREKLFMFRLKRSREKFRICKDVCGLLEKLRLPPA